MRFISYFRVSTDSQEQSGLGLEAQRRAVDDYVARIPGAVVLRSVTEVESGKRNDRPKIADALRMCRVYGATLLIAKIDRLARNVAFISTLMESGAEFVAVDLPQANKLTVHILAAMAEFEREQISERTKVGLASARLRGVKLGKPGNLTNRRAGTAASAARRSKRASERAVDCLPEIEAARSAGATSLRQIAAHLDRAGLQAPRGGAWSAVQVSRVLKRIEV